MDRPGETTASPIVYFVSENLYFHYPRKSAMAWETQWLRLVFIWDGLEDIGELFSAMDLRTIKLGRRFKVVGGV